MASVLFVCTGNICRSPTAEGVFRHLARAEGLERAFAWDSAGTQSFHEGEAPDARTVAAALRRGIDITDLRARRVRPEDFHAFDYIYAMDRGHYRALTGLCPRGARANISLFLESGGHAELQDVPDPWGRGDDGFDIVFEMIADATEKIFQDLKEKEAEK